MFPLSGVRVLSIEHIISLPWASLTLGALGAEVVCIERLAGLRYRRSRPYPDHRPGKAWWNQSARNSYFARYKESIALDLAAEPGRQIFRDLVAVSDVVCENNRPTAMERLGFSYEELRAINPAIVMLRISGFGQSGPWRDAVATGYIIQAMSGFYSVTGYPGSEPMRYEETLPDMLTGWNAALAVMVALWKRRRTGKGLLIDASMYETAAGTLGPALLAKQTGAPGTERWGNASLEHAPYGCYPCSGEDEWITLAVKTDDEWVRLVEVMGLPAWVEDTSLATVEGRLAQRERVDTRIGAWTRRFPKEVVFDRLRAVGIAVAPVMKAPDLLADPHIKARQSIQWVDHSPEFERVGTKPFPAPPYRFSRSHTPPPNVPALGEQNDYLVRELLGYPEGKVRDLEAAKVIGRVPTDEHLARPMLPPLKKLIEWGELARLDPNYQPLVKPPPKAG